MIHRAIRVGAAWLVSATVFAVSAAAQGGSGAAAVGTVTARR